MTGTLGIGIIGCGNISAAYFRLAPLFRGLEVRACTDINPAAAEARAKEFGVKAQTIDALLANPDIDVVINLTIPDAHYAVTRRRSRPASTSTPKNPSSSPSTRASSSSAWPSPRASASAPRPTPSSAAPTSSPASSSTTAGSAPSPPAPPT